MVGKSMEGNQGVILGDARGIPCQDPGSLKRSWANGVVEGWVEASYSDSTEVERLVVFLEAAAAAAAAAPPKEKKEAELGGRARKA